MRQISLQKQLLSAFIALAMILGTSGNAFAAAFKDTKGHWAESSIQSWVDKGFISGYKDGTFQPNGQVARAEFIALINRSFGLTATQAVAPADVKPSAWYFNDLAKAQAAGYLSVFMSNGQFKPLEKVTRLDAAFALYKLLALPASGSADQLPELAKASKLQKAAVGAVMDAKLMSLDVGGKFRASDKLTRAEAVVLLNRALKHKPKQAAVVYDKPGVYGGTNGKTEMVSSNVVISAPGVTLQDMMIEGDLTIAATVGDGDVFLKNVSVKGTTTVNGGGANSVHFENAVLVKVVVNKKDGSIRIVVEGSSEVREVVLESGAKLETSDATGAGVKQVTLANTLPANAKVTLAGKYETVDVLAANIMVSIPDGQIGSLNVGDKAGNVSVDIGEKAAIVDLVLKAVAKVAGKGSIEKAIIEADGASIEQTPKQVEIGKDVTAEVGGKPMAGSGSTGGIPGGSGGIPGGGVPGGGNPQPSVDKTALNSAINAAQNKHDQIVEGNDAGQYRYGTKAALLGYIGEAKAVYNNAGATQQQVNQAVSALNDAVEMIESEFINKSSIISQFQQLYRTAKLLYNSSEEGTSSGQAAVGSKIVFKQAIDAARLALNGSGLTGSAFYEAYRALGEAYMGYKNNFKPRNTTELDVLIEQAKTLLSQAVEGTLPGQYTAGSKKSLEADISYVEAIWRDMNGPQYDMNPAVSWLVWGLNIFEAGKVSANTTTVEPVEGGYHTSRDMNRNYFKIKATAAGTVYVVSYEAFPQSLSDLSKLKTEGSAVSLNVEANVTTQIDVSSLSPGKYKLYHVNGDGVLSKNFYSYLISHRNPLFVDIITKMGQSGSIANTVTWFDVNLPASEYTFTVMRNTSDDWTLAVDIVQALPSGTTQYIDTDPDLLPGTTYYYWVAAVSKQYYGTSGGPAEVTTPAEPSVETPTDPVDKESLDVFIGIVKKELEAAVEGYDKGQYPIGSKAELQYWVDVAKAVSDNNNVTQNIVDAAVSKLGDQLGTFWSSKNVLSISQKFMEQYRYSISSYNSSQVGHLPGQTTVEAMDEFKQAIGEAYELGITDDPIGQAQLTAYNALGLAESQFYKSFTPNNFVELDALIVKAEQLLAAPKKTIPKESTPPTEVGIPPVPVPVNPVESLQNYLNQVKERKDTFRGPQHEVDVMASRLIGQMVAVEVLLQSDNEASIAYVGDGNSASGSSVPQQFVITSSAVGTVYVVPYNQFPGTSDDLSGLVTAGKAVRFEITDYSQLQKIDVSSLPPGAYKLYHVNGSGKLSAAYSRYVFWPTPPQVKVSKADNGSYAIEWTGGPDSGDFTYSIKRATTNNFAESITIAEGLKPGTDLMIDNAPDLQSDKIYYYAVGIEYPGGFGKWSLLTTPSQ